ncbi:MAG: NAD-dependent epimerase/dehydratase family protein [Alphaproteobacteria bacterium]
MTIVVTGAAGFIGFHATSGLLARGDRIVGVDDLNDYYDVGLKRARLARLERHPAFAFRRLDVARWEDMQGLADPSVTAIVHLAAQAGVRHSLDQPFAYGRSNVVGQIAIGELARRCPNLRHVVYASSSSVYGRDAGRPFRVTDRADRPVSLYGATKRAAELIAASYSHVHRLPMTGLRYFTVYGPWGRPDMAAYRFTKAIFAGQPITLFNGGDLRRDFTYIDDIVAGTLAALDRPPPDDGTVAPHRIYNLGNSRCEDLRRFVQVLEGACGRLAEIRHGPMQPGDVYETLADITEARRDLGFEPTTRIEDGVPRFVAWFRDYHGV